MKKLVSILLLLVMAFSLFACNTGSGNKTPDSNFVVPDNGYDGSEVTIKFYHTMGQNLRDVLDTYIVEFNKLFPNIHIEHEQVGSYDDVRDQLSTEITAGNQPNIAYCYPDHVALYNLAGSVVSLDNLIASTITVKHADGTDEETLGLTAKQKADFIEAYYEEGAQYGDGRMYTMPLSKSTEVLYYNKTFFAANNLSVPTTWDELEALCKRIKEIDPACIPLGYDSESNWFITMCEQYGSDYTSATGDHFRFDNQTNRDFVKKFRTWYANGYITTQKIYGSYTSGLFVAQGTNDDGTAKTRSYMSIGSSAGATHQRPEAGTDGNYPFEVGIAPIPQVNASNPKVISQGPSLCIFKKDNAQEVVASWLFVKYLATTPAFQAEFSMESGYVPVIKSVSQDSTYKAFLEKADGGKFIAALSAKVCLAQERAYYTSPAFNGSSKARDQVGALLVKCLSEETTDIDSLIDRAFKDAIDECNYSIGN